MTDIVIINSLLKQKEKLWAISNEMPFVCKEIQRLLQVLLVFPVNSSNDHRSVLKHSLYLMTPKQANLALPERMQKQ